MFYARVFFLNKSQITLRLLKQYFFSNMTSKNCKRLIWEELNIPCKKMGLYLLGKILVRKLEDGSILKGKIVETECYLGGEDQASHSRNGRRTPANEPMYMKSGTAFVYMTYGLYYCFNVSSEEEGAAVLIRALEPTEGLEVMKQRRNENQKSLRGNGFTKCKLCNGPSKLCMAMNITKESCNKLDICVSDELWLEEPEENEATKDYDDKEIRVVTTSRIGIESVAKEWRDKPLRFYIFRNKFVSKFDKKAEKELLEEK